MFSKLKIDGGTVAVDPTPTVLDSVTMGALVTEDFPGEADRFKPERTSGVVWQVKNLDGSQVLECYPEIRQSETADWVRKDFTDELASIGPGETKEVMWRFVCHDVRLVATASGAGLDAQLWRRNIYGVQPT